MRVAGGMFSYMYVNQHTNTEAYDVKSAHDADKNTKTMASMGIRTHVLVNLTPTLQLLSKKQRHE